MLYSIEPASFFCEQLYRLIIKAGTEKENKWFFTDGAFSPEIQLEHISNTWLHENFVIICNNEIVSYFEANWSNPLKVITSFRLIIFNKKKSFTVIKAFFQYLDYLFECRGCKAFNWIVAEKNVHAYKLYEKFIKHYCGHLVGYRTYGQMAYDGEISNVFLYEINKEEYNKFKEK